MENKLLKYGVKTPVHRPRIVATKQLDLNTNEGRELVRLEAKNQLRIHRKTFERLAVM